MPVLDRAALEASPLADLHAIASELAMERYRRLRKEDLIDAIIARQDGEEQLQDAGAEEDAEEQAASGESSGGRRRGRRGGRGRGSRGTGDPDDEKGAAEDTEEAVEEKPKRAGRKKSADKDDRDKDARDKDAREQGERDKRDRAKSDRGAKTDTREKDAPNKGGDKDVPDRGEDRDEFVEGVVELLPNGSGFIRVSPPDPSDSDVYISAAQAKRCELVSGDVVGGPRRPPGRSERFASLFRIETINGKPASDIADRGRFDDLAATFPTERFAFGAEDPTVAAIELLTPFGRGSRVTITGDAWAGKSEALRRLALALAGEKGITPLIALVGVRPEELPEWASAEGLPVATAALSFAASSDAQDHAVELAIEQARRVAARGEDAVVLIDTLEGLHPHTARKALATARNLADGGSVTVIATRSQPLGGETTVIALDRSLTAAARFPALDLAHSGTLRAELLVGEDGARAIAEARAQALSDV